MLAAAKQQSRTTSSVDWLDSTDEKEETNTTVQSLQCSCECPQLNHNKTIN